MTLEIILKRISLALFRIAAAIVLFMFTLGIVSVVDPVMRKKKASFKHNVEKDTPGIFPVLILMPAVEKGRYNAKIIPYEDLASYQKNHRSITFLVPPYLKKSLNAELAADCEEIGRKHRENYKKNREDCFSVGFTVEKESPGRQSLQVSYMFDDDRPNTGWYEATDKQIFPKYHEYYFGPALIFGWGMVDLVISILITVLIWRLLTRAYRKWRGKCGMFTPTTQKRQGR